MTIELSTLKVPVFCEWRPIGTAPKDQHLLLFGQMEPCDGLHTNGPEVFTGYWDGIDSAWCGSSSTCDGPFYAPTHWMGLPEPPHEDGK